MFRLEGKIAIVTGGARGIGAETARVFRDAGATVVTWDVSDGADARVDVTDVMATAEGAAAVAKEHGRIDVLVNNAGILRDAQLVKAKGDEITGVMSEADFDAVISVNLRGVFACTQAVAPTMIRQRSGRILNASSVVGLYGNFGQTNYGAAKAGIAAFSTITAMEMAKYGVTCNAIAPAARTRMTESAYGHITTDSDFDFWHPDNVAPLVAFLCSDASAHISGKVFGVQGDAVELYRPFTSAAAMENDGKRWEPDQIKDRIDALFTEAGIVPQAENMMAKLRYTMTDRA